MPKVSWLAFTPPVEYGLFQIAVYRREMCSRVSGTKEEKGQIVTLKGASLSLLLMLLILSYSSGYSFRGSFRWHYLEN